MAHVNLTADRDAPSFSPTPSQGNTNSYVYDVFINHCDSDVKKTLASHIYLQLKQQGLAVFLDQQDLQEGENTTPQQEGENTTPQIEGAIRTASVHVAIFSPGYAESSWCLEELAQMLESGSTIIPVFYKVEPSDLLWTRAGDRDYARTLKILLCILCMLVLCIPLSIFVRILLFIPLSIIPWTLGENRVYARALRTLQMKTTFDPQTNKKKPRYDSDTIEKWRKALSDVSQISGFELNSCNGDEGQLVDKVVQQVLKKVRRPAPNVDRHPRRLPKKQKNVMTVSLQF